MTLHILIAESSLESRQATAKYFSSRSDILIDYAASFAEAKQKLDGQDTDKSRGRVYAFAIFNNELSVKTGLHPKKLGSTLADIAAADCLDYAMLSIEHKQGKQEVYAKYCWAPDYWRYLGISLSDSHVWKQLYETLEIHHTPESLENMLFCRKLVKKCNMQPTNMMLKSYKYNNITSKAKNL